MMCLNLMLHFAAFFALALNVRAQDIYYITSAFTECFPVATAAYTLSADPAESTDPMELMSEATIVGPSNPIYPPSVPPTDSGNPEGWQPPGIVTYSMPPCAVCDCPTCTITSVFTTMFPDFGSRGPTERPYIVTETYVGMSSLPYFPTPTSIPYGFTTAVETCTDCGAQPITGTMVVPKTGRPWGQDISESTGHLGTYRPGTLPPESGARLAPGATTTSSNIGPVETTLITSRESGPEITQAGGQDSGSGHGGASTRGSSLATPTYIHVSAAESTWSDCVLSYGVVVSTFCIIVLFQ